MLNNVKEPPQKKGTLPTILEKSRDKDTRIDTEIQEYY